MKFIPYLYFISILSVLYIPNWTVIDPKAQHWFHLSIINTIFLIYIGFTGRDKINSVLREPVFLSISAFFLISCISATYAINYIESLVKLTDIYVILSSVLITLYFATTKELNIKVILNTILISILLDLAGSFYQFSQIIGSTEFTFEYSNSIKSIYGNKNIAAMAYMIKFPMLLILQMKTKSRLYKIIISFILVLTFYMLLLLSSRTAFLALTLSILLIALLIFIKKFMHQQNIIKDLNQFKNFLLPLIIAFVIFKISINQEGDISVEKRVTSIIQNENDASTYERFRFYSHAISHIRSNPLLGCGIGNWRLLSIKYDSETMYSYVIPYFAHNDFLEVFAETGIFGFLSYLMFFFFLFKEALKKILIWLKSQGNYIAILLSLCLIYYLVDANLNFPIDRPSLQIPFLYFICLLYSSKEAHVK